MPVQKLTQYDAPQPVNWEHYLINGRLEKWDGAFEEVYSPMGAVRDDGTVEKVYLGRSPLLSADKGQAALDAARQAYAAGRGEWPTASAETRLEAMEKFLARFKELREEVSTMLMWEIAKNRQTAYKEFDRTAQYMEDTLTEYKRMHQEGSHVSAKDGIISQTRRGPLGVVLCLGPYNYPLNETFCLLVPALLMGNAVIFKPAKYGVLLLTPLVKAFQECFPPGVVNIIFGRGRTLASHIMTSVDVDVLALIGNSKSSNKLIEQHPKPNRLRQILSLEANNPAIVFEDADLDLSVKQCVNGALSYNGQRCTALKVIFVHRSVADAFLEKFTQAVDALELGHPMDNTPLTPLPERGKVEAMQELVEDAEAQGARVMNKRAGKLNDTCFFPAVLYPVHPDMRVYREEQFGPLIPVIAYDDLEEVMDSIAQSDYGQQASLFTTQAATVAYAVDNLVNQVCRVNINSPCQRGPDYLPFTGRKDSATGTLSVHDALRSFSIRTLVAAQEDEKDLVRQVVSQGQSTFMTTDYIL